MALERWEEEILAGHRWGMHGKDSAEKERRRLSLLWKAAAPEVKACNELIEQIIGLEICNWRLTEMIPLVCGAIGRGAALAHGTGHMATMTNERWRRVWAYRLSLMDWLHCGSRNRTAYPALLDLCDPEGFIRSHVEEMLGERAELKELYARRVCEMLDLLLGGCFPLESASGHAHAAAAQSLEEKIRARDAEGDILGHLREYREGKYIAYIGLELCHHKFFRRLDIILSSIGAGRWRGAMPVRGTDGFGRADEVDRCLQSIERWVEGGKPENERIRSDIHSPLGARDEVKLFLASLLVSLLKSQTISARRRAQKHQEESGSAVDAP